MKEEFYETPWGPGRLVTVDDLPLKLELPDLTRSEGTTRSAGKTPKAEPTGEPGAKPASPWRRLLERYFAGRRVVFELNVPAFVAAHSCTRFSADVYAALAAVPYGEVVSYRDLAALAGYPNAYRAVGSAMARNPLPVILPCHRVVKNDGSCGKYGQDSSWKPRLLALEGSACASGEVRL